MAPPTSGLTLELSLCHLDLSEDEPLAKRVSVAEAKRRFSDVVGAVRHGSQRFVIERRGSPVAAIVPIDDLATLEGKGTRGVLAMVGAFRDAKDLPKILDGIVRARQSRATASDFPLRMER
jgi:prevent-host-death family protein